MSRLIAARVERARLLERLRQDLRRLFVAPCRRHAETDRQTAQTFPRGDCRSGGRSRARGDISSNAGVERAEIGAAGAHHDAVCRQDARQSGGLVQLDAFRKQFERRGHAAVQILRVGKAAERVRPPFRRIEPQRDLERGRVLVSARIKLAAGKVQIAAQVVNLGERAVGGGGARRRLGFRQRSEGVVELGEQPVGRGDADQRAHTVPFGAAIGKRVAIGFERLPPAAGVKLEIADLQGEVDAVLEDRLRWPVRGAQARSPGPAGRAPPDLSKLQGRRAPPRGRTQDRDARP